MPVARSFSPEPTERLWSGDFDGSSNLSLGPLALVDDDEPTQSPTSATSDNNDLHKLIIGIDFGTTYTGISYVHTSGSHIKTLEDVHCIKSWPGPGREGDSAWKTPSRIAYGSDNGCSRNEWGYGVTPKMKAYTWMKLRLDPEQATKYDDPSLRRSEGEGILSLPPGKSAVDVCADYLREIAIFAYDTLQQRVSPEVLAISPLEFWLTVPAVWSDKAKNDTLRAAERAARSANLSSTAKSSTFLISEPEAAAVAAVSSITQGGSRRQINPNDNIMVCDCGGGTVDITTYTVASLEPSLEFREYLVGTGGKCGSTYIDRQFLTWMENKFGTAFTSLPREKTGPASRFMKDFECHKKDFGISSDANKEYEMTLPMKGVLDSQYYDTEEQVVKLYNDDLKHLFDPVVEKIVALINSQVKEDVKQSGRVTIKTIILVGGFGDSAYLNKTLRVWCERHSIRLICPEYPQAAIVRGAALSGLHNLQPTFRRARRHYGVPCAPRYDRRRHDPKHVFVDDWDGLEYSYGYMDWALCKGDSVTEGTEINLNFLLRMREDAPKKYSRDIYRCDRDTAPARIDDRGVKKLATIAVDLTNTDLSSCESRIRNGKKLIQVQYTLQVKFGSRRGVLCFQYLVDGKEVGSTTVNFDGDDGSGDGEDGGSGVVEAMKDESSCCVM